MCLANIQQAFTLVQMALSLAFGMYSVTHPTPPFLRTYPSARSLRHRSFRSCSRTNTSHQIDVPRGECAEHSRYSQQGRGGILRGYYHDTFLDSGYVCWGEGGVHRNSIRV